jgi:hypothetical protein
MKDSFLLTRNNKSNHEGRLDIYSILQGVSGYRWRATYS